jgi:hypothetical protein
MRCGEEKAMPPPSDGSAAIALNLLRGRRFFYNEVDSMSGILALASDLEGMGETLDIFSHREQCGSHRRSIKAVAEGAADLAAIHFKSFLRTYRTYSQVAGKHCIYGIIYLQRRACGKREDTTRYAFRAPCCAPWGGKSDVGEDSPYGNQERISERPLIFRDWLSKEKNEVDHDTMFEHLDGCRFRVTSVFPLGQAGNERLVSIIDFSKAFYPSDVNAAGPYKGIYQPQWFPGFTCREREAGTVCNEKTETPGIRRDINRIRAAVRHMNDRYCKTRAF